MFHRERLLLQDQLRILLRALLAGHLRVFSRRCLAACLRGQLLRGQLRVRTGLVACGLLGCLGVLGLFAPLFAAVRVLREFLPGQLGGRRLRLFLRHLRLGGLLRRRLRFLYRLLVPAVVQPALFPAGLRAFRQLDRRLGEEPTPGRRGAEVGGEEEAGLLLGDGGCDLLDLVDGGLGRFPVDAQPALRGLAMAGPLADQAIGQQRGIQVSDEGGRRPCRSPRLAGEPVRLPGTGGIAPAARPLFDPLQPVGEPAVGPPQRLEPLPFLGGERAAPLPSPCLPSVGAAQQRVGSRQVVHAPPETRRRDPGAGDGDAQPSDRAAAVGERVEEDRVPPGERLLDPVDRPLGIAECRAQGSRRRLARRRAGSRERAGRDAQQPAGVRLPG